jgi:tryptophan synthase beta chain
MSSDNRKASGQSSAQEYSSEHKQDKKFSACTEAERRAEIWSHFGDFGGQFVAETLIPTLDHLRDEFYRLKELPSFREELRILLNTYAGRPTPVFYARNISADLGIDVYLKREDLLHTGAHKINNTIGQALMAKYMGKPRVIAETGAGQHGVATATVASLLGLECVVYMGEVDAKRQRPNVMKMELLGAKVEVVKEGSRTLKDATNAALRDFVKNVQNTHYIIGSVVGPFPYPLIVQHFQSVIGDEARQYFLQSHNKLPDKVIACVGGGSNAIGIFKAFLGDAEVELIGVEAGGRSDAPGEHARTLGQGKRGILHGALSYLIQNSEGQVADVHSISAGLDYPGIGPVHAHLHQTQRVTYDFVRDDDVIEALKYTARHEGIIPALESSHAISYLIQNARKWREEAQQAAQGTASGQLSILVNLSGRGDKDMDYIKDFL